MKNYYFIAAAALLSLAACTKNEVRPIAGEPQEITFQTVVGPQTKALGAYQVSFYGDQFKSYAWFLQRDKSWAADKAESKKYIDGAIISNTGNDEAGRKIWKEAGKTYYWPKQGSLTFFSWTLLAPTTNSADFGKADVECTSTDGIKVTDYDVFANKNYDLMVANIAADKSHNESIYEASGVPTLFRHILSKLEFNVATKDDYAGVKFALTGISLKNVSLNGTYTQGVDAAKEAIDGSWSPATQDKELPYLSTGTLPIVKTSTLVGANGYDTVMPQTFGNESPIVEIVYTITTEYVSGVPVTETVIVNKPLKDIFTDGWKAGKKYITAITIGLDEILWDPAVVDWDPINGSIEL